MSIIYNTTAWAIGFIMPMSLSVVIYVLIKIKLRQHVEQAKQNKKAKSKKLAVQLLMMNTFEILSFLLLIAIYVLFLTGSGGTLLQVCKDFKRIS